MDWFLYDKELRHERVKVVSRLLRLNSEVHRILLNHLVLFFAIYCVSVKQNKTKQNKTKNKAFMVSQG